MRRLAFLALVLMTLVSAYVPSTARANTVSTFCNQGGVTGVPYPTLYCDYTWGPGGATGGLWGSMNTWVEVFGFPGQTLDFHGTGFVSIAGTGVLKIAVTCWTPSDVYVILGQGRTFTMGWSPTQGLHYIPVGPVSYSQATALLTPAVLPCPGFGL